MQDRVGEVIEGLERERPDLNYQPWGIILRITRLAEYLHYSESLYEPFGLNRSGVEILLRLRRAPDYRVSPTQLNRALDSKSATTTSRLEKLEQAGLITRVLDPNDRRSLLVQLTDRGRDLIDEVSESVLDIRARQLAVLSENEQETFIDLMRKLLVSFEREPVGAAATAQGEPS
jgi:DNA-binding MarR family transcriptional regulator